MSTTPDKFVIIDGNAIMHRAWHALPPLTTKSGLLINAAYGFTSILIKVLKDLKPDYVAVTFDLKEKTFRHEQFDGYKATRKKQPDELYNQLPLIKEVVTAFSLPIFEKSGFEADDVIGTLVKEKSVQNLQTVIVTGDLDTLQLVDKNTTVYAMHKGISDSIIYDETEVKKRFDGLTPAQMIDYKSLKGDPSDNISGVPGIGEKGAINLIKEFGSLENIYKNLNSKKITPRYQKLLAEHKDKAELSKKLSTIITNVPINFDLKAAEIKPYDPNIIIPLFQKLEFKSLLSRLPKDLQSSTAGQSSFYFGSTVESKSEIKNLKSEISYTLINTPEKFSAFLNELKKQTIFALDTETDSLNPHESTLLGISFCWQPGVAYYLPADNPEYIEKLKPILADPAVKKIGQNLKFDLQTLAHAGINLAGIDFDTMVASYLLAPGTRGHGLDNLAFIEFGYQMQPITDLIGTGKNQITLAQVPLEKVSWYSCEDADFTWRLVKPLTKQLEEKNNLDLLKKIEVPLIPVLAGMETKGVKIDTTVLKKMSATVTKKLGKLESEIYKLSKEKFNINSPLQLKEILFAKLKISPAGLGKTKTGLSTAADELEKIKNVHKIVPKILDYRELYKLKSTYLDALPKLLGADGRVHTSFNQIRTATGRLSSFDPNLQNIPVRTDLGKKIRTAFVAEKNFTLLKADYSQIELRLVASLANDPAMIKSFLNQEDIHTRTAANINEIKLTEVTPEQRRAAKAVNFGIIYGMGANALAAQEGITYQKAHEFIDKYFELHKKIKQYLENTKELALKFGYVETIFGRRRYLPDIASGVPGIRAAAERAAINHPVQGSCADLIKLAMIEIFAGLPKISSESKMILQVHDELVFEVPSADVSKVAKFVKEKMEKIYTLRVPIEVEIKNGENWGNMKELQ